MRKPAALIVSVLLWLIAVAQFLRFILRVHIVANGIEIPVWISAVAAVVFACLGTWLWKERKR